MTIGEVTGVAIGGDIKYHMRGALSFGEKSLLITMDVTQNYRHIAEVALYLTSHKNDQAVIAQRFELFLESVHHRALWSCTTPQEALELKLWVATFCFENTTLQGCMRKVDTILTALDKTLAIAFRPHAVAR